MTVGENIDEKRVTFIKNSATCPMRRSPSTEIWKEVDTPSDVRDWYDTADTTPVSFLQGRNLV